jgi:hypothetical protein
MPFADKVFLQESGRGSAGIERSNDDVMVPDLPFPEKSASARIDSSRSSFCDDAGQNAASPVLKPTRYLEDDQ